MFLLVLKLLVRTRLSKPFLLFLVLMGFIDITVSISGIESGGASQSFFGEAFLVFIYYMILTVVTLLGNGLGMTKPDADFLLPSSIKGKTLNYAFFTVQLISVSLIFIILSVAYSIGLYRFTDEAALFVLDFAMLGVTLTSLSVIVSDFDILYRVPVFASVSVFLFSFLLHFNYSPFSVLTGHLYQATIGTAILFSVTFAFALRWIRHNDLYEKMPRLLMKKETFKDRLSFTGMSAPNAIFRHYFMHFFSGRPIGMSGSVLALTNRYRLKIALTILSAISVAIVVGIYFLKPPSATYLYPILITLIVYLSFVVDSALYGTAFSVERLWLSAMSMPYHAYIRRMVFAQTIQAAVVELPLATAVAVLGFMYGNSLFPLLIALLVITPEAVALMSALSVVAKPPQAWENAVMIRRVGLKRAIYLLPYSLVMLTGILLSILSPFAVAAEAVALGIIMFLILSRKNYWEKMVSKLAESNYI